MKFSTSKILVPVVLVAAGVCVAVFWGRREEPKPVDPASPASYMHDSAFIGDLAARRAQHSDLMRARNAIAEKMKAMVDAKCEEMKTRDVKKVQAELEKDPAWRELYVQCTNANAVVERNRRETFAKVRARLTPQNAATQQAQKNVTQKNVAPQKQTPQKEISK